MSIAPYPYEFNGIVIPMTEKVEQVQACASVDDLLDQSYQAAYRVAFRLLGDRDASQDAAIESVSRLIEKNLQSQEFAPSYAARVASRIVISSWRKDAIAKKYSHLVHQTPAHESSSGDVNALRIDLRKAIQKLPTRQREVIVLRYLADLTEQAVADFLKISLGTVKSTAHDALARLKTMVEVSP